MRALNRRDVIIAGAAALSGAACAGERKGQTMYGLIGKITAVDGERDALIAILLGGVSGMPGCLSYVVARDPADANAIWVTEVWDSPESHQASLLIPSVKDAITRGRPLIAGMTGVATTAPVGGHGLAAPADC